MAGRRTDLTAREALLRALRGGASVSDAAAAAGYARTYVYQLARRDPEVAALLPGRPPGAPAAPSRPGPAGPAPAATAAADAGLRAEAIAVLRSIAGDERAPAGPRVAAARALLGAAAVVAVEGDATQAGVADDGLERLPPGWHPWRQDAAAALASEEMSRRAAACP